MRFSSINGEIREIPAEYKCENLFKLDLKATSISGEQNAFEHIRQSCLKNQLEIALEHTFHLLSLAQLHLHLTKIQIHKKFLYIPPEHSKNLHLLSLH